MESLAKALAALTLAAVLSTPGAALAEKRPVEPTRTWKGSVADENRLPQELPVVIHHGSQLQELWEHWQIKEPLPQVDFARELVVATATRGSVLRLALTLDDRGNLEVGGLSTMDLRPGFRYVIATVSRAGVNTVNGKRLETPASSSSTRGQP
ncbi:MAG: hypothetical protein WHT07_04135 [Desulfobaccales bacterium]